MLMVDTAPPTEKSETISRSPSKCVPTKVPPAVQAELEPLVSVPTPVHIANVESCTNQNPAVESPLLPNRSMPATTIVWPFLEPLVPW